MIHAKMETILKMEVAYQLAEIDQPEDEEAEF